MGNKKIEIHEHTKNEKLQKENESKEKNLHERAIINTTVVLAAIQACKLFVEIFFDFGVFRLGRPGV